MIHHLGCAARPLARAVSGQASASVVAPFSSSVLSFQSLAAQPLCLKRGVLSCLGQRRFCSFENSRPIDTSEGKLHTHSRQSASEHPLRIKKVSQREAEEVQAQRLKLGTRDREAYKYDSQTWSLPMVNHLWSPKEVKERMARPHPQHKPETWADKFVYHLVKNVLYRGFNFVTGYDYTNPTPKSAAYRIILLESVAGVPGMVAGVLRHFKSLRTLERDHGWIHTLLEEAQNERMHLLVSLHMFNAGRLTRLSVFGAQFCMVPFLTIMYLLNPKMMHRLVGYLEECATETYTSLVEKSNTPGTKLYKAWQGIPASSFAKAYWNLPEDAEWVHVLEQILADETNHRDVNHTFADMDADDPNPHVEKHIQDLENLWRRDLAPVRQEP